MVGHAGGNSFIPVEETGWWSRMIENQASEDRREGVDRVPVLGLQRTQR